MTKEEFEMHQGTKRWNVIASLLFGILCIAMYVYFVRHKPENFGISLIDLIVLCFANFRLIRLFIYDNITLFIREFLMDLKVYDFNDSKKYEFINSKNSLKLTLHKLMNCPWCFGVWITFVSSFFYFTFPFLKIPFVILAISSVASFLILLTNLIGWHAEAKKLEVQGK